MTHVEEFIEVAEKGFKCYFSLTSKKALSTINIRRNLDYKYLNPLQCKSLKASGHSDSMVILPTGYGKSLTFELLQVINRSQVIIVSPLNAIIEEQVSMFRADFACIDSKLIQMLKNTGVLLQLIWYYFRCF